VARSRHYEIFNHAFIANLPTDLKILKICKHLATMWEIAEYLSPNWFQVADNVAVFNGLIHISLETYNVQTHAGSWTRGGGTF